MPRLSLYRPEKGNDFRFLDRQIEEQFQVGGVDIYVHKYMGPATEGVDAENTPGTAGQTSTITPELSIQDVILMENRDRKYDPDIYVMRGIYQMQDLDFNLSQFGIFLNNDNIFMHLHLRNCVDTLGRKIMAGDVLELPHLKDEYALDDANVALKRFYVVQDVTRSANGFSQTWYPHLLRVKCAPLVDTQEYADIFNKDAGAGDGSTIRDLISTYNRNISINEQIIAQAEADAPSSGYDTNQLYVLPLNDDGTLMLSEASMDDQIPDASWDWDDTTGATSSDTAPINPSVGAKWLDTRPVAEFGEPVLKIWNGHFWAGNAIDAGSVFKSPKRDLYISYLNGDGRPPNGAPYTFGITFPTSVVEGQFHLRTDYFPNRLFRYNGQHWMKFEDNVRMTMTNSYDANEKNPNNTVPQEVSQTRKTQRTGFINNNNTATIAGQVVQERQALSKVLKPKADN
jgi:hypothetical protein